VLENIRARFEERGILELPAPNRRVAQVPEGARKLDNPVGTAPGLALKKGGALVVLLPGVPREMMGIVQGSDFDDALAAHFGDRLAPVWMRMVHTTGIPESLLSEQVAAALPDGTAPLELAFLPKVHGVALRFTGFSLDATEAERRFAEIRRALRDVLSPWTFHADSGDLAEAVSEALRSADLTVAAAESCTGGLIAKRLTELPGASEVFVGGLVAYSNELKVDLLGVTRTVLQEGGAVSEAVARQMAVGVASLLGSGAGIGITGVAGPTGGTVDKPVGTVWYAAAVGPRVVARGERFPGDRGAIRERSAQAALFLLLRLLEGRVEG
jgi:nicotinamide-nucleotide amidase